jgi:hypothetical protein
MTAPLTPERALESLAALSASDDEGRVPLDLVLDTLQEAYNEVDRLRAQVTPTVAQIFHQRGRNHERWGDLSIEKRPPDYAGWLPTLGEEFGEVCETLVAEGSRSQLRAELIDLAAVALMWLDSIDRATLTAGDEVQS